MDNFSKDWLKSFLIILGFLLIQGFMTKFEANSRDTLMFIICILQLMIYFSLERKKKGEK